MVDGDEVVCDPTLAYGSNPGDEERFAHPHSDSDDCTAISFDPSLAALLWGDGGMLPSGPLPTSPHVDLAHRLLLAGARRTVDPDELVESAIATAARAVQAAEPDRVDVGRPTTTRARKALVDAARQALAADPDLSVVQLAQVLAISPHHLSRLFRAATGQAISRHRLRLRTRAALERLADGERHLARVAADAGFADQSHLWRVMQQETGVAPSLLRTLLADGDRSP